MSQLKEPFGKECKNQIHPKRILCAWLPNWPIQRIVVEHEHLRRQRVILFHQHAQRGQLVSAASPLAMAAGVRIGMPLSEAKSLCEKSSVSRLANNTQSKSGSMHFSNSMHFSGPLYFFEHETDSDDKALKELALGCDSFSPIIGLDQDTFPSSILMDVTGLAHLFGNEKKLVNQVAQHLHECGYVSHVAIAPTIITARGAAQFAHQIKAESNESNAHPPVTERPTTAHPTTEQSAAERLVLQTPKASWDASILNFHSLEISALGLAPQTVDTLNQLGIQRIEQILQLPRSGLRSRFGDEVIRQLDRASGAIEQVIVSLEYPAEFSAETFVEYPLSDCETVEVILERLVSQLCAQMRSGQRGSLSWQFKLTGTENRSVSGESPSHLQFEVNLFQPATTSEHVMQLAKMQLQKNHDYQKLSRTQKSKRSKKRQRHHHAAGFSFQSFEVSVPSTVLLVQRQTSLFDEDNQPVQQALSHFVNRMSSQLGAENVIRARLQPGSSPEHAVCYETMVGGARVASKNHAAESAHGKTPPGPTKRDGQHSPPALPRVSGNSYHSKSTPGAFSPLERPLKLYTLPLETQPIVSNQALNQPRAKNSLPSGFVLQNRKIKVARCWGPERIETRWWNAATTRRNYWRVETESGHWLWVFQDLRNHKWFVHGEF